jgi:hypothetical protein
MAAVDDGVEVEAGEVLGHEMIIDSCYYERFRG